MISRASYKLSSCFSNNRAVSSSRIRKLSSIPSTLYNNVWRKSNVLYITYVIVGCVILEGVYGTVTNAIWDACNKGKQYKDIDWSKFKSEDE